MAESEECVPDVEQGEEGTPGYKPPAEKSIDEIMKADQDDESLIKYKQQLLGSETIFFHDDPRKVILKKMSILVEGRDDLEIDLSDESQLQNMKFKVKEGATYQLMITFHVQREIVAGLRFTNKVKRLGVQVGSETYMCGSYGPKAEPYQFKTTREEFPSGKLARSEYKVKSRFVDDDKNVILAWDWKFDLKKEWES